MKTSMTLRRGAVVVLAGLISMLALAACSRGDKTVSASAAPPVAAEPAGPTLYILDCGTITAMDPALYSLKKEEIKRGETSFVSPCYLIVHPKGTLAWDLGQVPDAKIPEDGTEVVEQDVLKATRRLDHQLEALGHPIKDITFVAMSHYHADHTANANAFAGSTWIVQQADYDMMIKEGDIPIRTPETYQALMSARRITLNNEDHDVFGDGTVVIKTAPGHTPGHQMLFLRLRKFGPLLLAGDLYHLPEEKTLDRVPTFDFDAAMTRATRKKVDAFLAETGATMWIQHDPATNAPLRKAPEFYD
jgi:glyoxylase-like metal-dependent hydrolase (beta-lactamase superfamily II)